MYLYAGHQRLAVEKIIATHIPNAKKILTCLQTIFEGHHYISTENVRKFLPDAIPKEVIHAETVLSPLPRCKICTLTLQFCVHLSRREFEALAIERRHNYPQGRQLGIIGGDGGGWRRRRRGGGGGTHISTVKKY
jgi:hypothetical protein